MHGMTQKDLAKKVGVTFQQIQKYESAGNRISADTLKRIADAFELSIGQLVDGGAPTICAGYVGGRFDKVNVQQNGYKTTSGYSDYCASYRRRIVPTAGTHFFLRVVNFSL